MTITKFIKVLEELKAQAGDLPVAFYNKSEKSFGSFLSVVMESPDGDFVGFMNDVEGRELLKERCDDIRDGEEIILNGKRFS